MKKEKFITVMAILDGESQKKFQELNEIMRQECGEKDGKTQGIPYHISLGSYAVEDTEEIVERMKQVCKQTKGFPIEFKGLQLLNKRIYIMKPEINDNLMDLHLHFDSDYANNYPEWLPHATVYISEEDMEFKLCWNILSRMQKMRNARIVGIELGEFFPAKFITRELFEGEEYFE